MHCINLKCSTRVHSTHQCAKNYTTCIYWQDDETPILPYKYCQKGVGPWHHEDKTLVDDNRPLKKEVTNKLLLSMVPRGIVEAIARVREYGCNKYKDPNGWKLHTKQDYWEATLRHIEAARNNVDAIDTESGLKHIELAACNLAFILSGDIE